MSWNHKMYSVLSLHFGLFYERAMQLQLVGLHMFQSSIEEYRPVC